MDWEAQAHSAFLSGFYTKLSGLSSNGKAKGSAWERSHAGPPGRLQGNAHCEAAFVLVNSGGYYQLYPEASVLSLFGGLAYAYCVRHSAFPI